MVAGYESTLGNAGRSKNSRNLTCAEYTGAVGASDDRNNSSKRPTVGR